MRSTTCEMEEEGYPHPGCAEFGPPDTWACGMPGVAVLAYTHTNTDFARYVESPIHSEMTLCVEHLRWMYTEEIDDPTERDYIEHLLADDTYPEVIEELVAVL